MAFLMRDFNTREFLFIRRAMDESRELFNAGYPRDALALLRKPKTQLESKVAPLRMLALLCLQEAEILLALNRKDKALADLKQAEDVLAAIEDKDESLSAQIQALREKAGSALDVR